MHECYTAALVVIDTSIPIILVGEMEGSVANRFYVSCVSGKFVTDEIAAGLSCGVVNHDDYCAKFILWHCRVRIL
jgi:hypothetical protein